MTAQEIMTTTLITVRPETEVREIAQLMLRQRIGAVPVVGADGHLVGIVREADLLHRAETGTERRHSWWAALLAAPLESRPVPRISSWPGWTGDAKGGF